MEVVVLVLTWVKRKLLLKIIGIINQQLFTISWKSRQKEILHSYQLPMNLKKQEDKIVHWYIDLKPNHLTICLWKIEGKDLIRIRITLEMILSMSVTLFLLLFRLIKENWLELEWDLVRKIKKKNKVILINLKNLNFSPTKRILAYMNQEFNQTELKKKVSKSAKKKL